jgi:hypothetical protein
VAWSEPPTNPQLNELRRLAERAGQSFAYPATRADASKELQRLGKAEKSTAAERAIDRKEIVRDDHPMHSAARIYDDEIEGYGSSARWRGASY